ELLQPCRLETNRRRQHSVQPYAGALMVSAAEPVRPAGLRTGPARADLQLQRLAFVDAYLRYLEPAFGEPVSSPGQFSLLSESRPVQRPAGNARAVAVVAERRCKGRLRLLKGHQQLQGWSGLLSHVSARRFFARRYRPELQRRSR